MKKEEIEGFQKRLGDTLLKFLEEENLLSGDTDDQWERQLVYCAKLIALGAAIATQYMPIGKAHHFIQEAINEGIGWSRETKERK